MVTLKYYNNVFSLCDAPANYTGIMQTFGGVYKKPGAGPHALVPACLHMQAGTIAQCCSLSSSHGLEAQVSAAQLARDHFRILHAR